MAVTLLVALLLVYLGDAAERFSGTALVNGTASLRCNFRNVDSVPWEALALYWQRGREASSPVVYEMHGREPVTKHISLKYQNRTTMQGNCDLEVHNVTSDDQGQYDCIVLKLTNGNRDQIHVSTFQLNVFANFSMPKISSDSPLIKVKNGSIVDLNCSSGDGFPRPETMYWNLSDGSITQTEKPDAKIFNRSEKFTILSNLLQKVEHNVNITCILKAHHDGVSEVLQIVIEGEPDQQDPPNFFLIPCVVVLIFITVLSIMLAIYKNRRKCSTGSSQSNGSLAMPQRDAGTSNTGQAEGASLMEPKHQAASA